MNLLIRDYDHESHTCCFRLFCRDDCRARSPIFRLRLTEAQDFTTLQFENRVPEKIEQSFLLVFQDLMMVSKRTASLFGEEKPHSWH